MNKRFISVALLGCTSFASVGGEFAVSYDGFYDRMKVVNKGDYLQARVGFYLVDANQPKDACEIASGKIVTEKSEQPFSFTQAGQLLLPFEQQLDKDKAVVVAQTLTEQCQLKMQIEAIDNYQATFTQGALFDTFTELDELMDDLSGFFMTKVFSFLMPTMTGITLEFAQPVEVIGGANWLCDGLRCRVTVNDDWQTNPQTVSFSAAPVRILPYFEQ